MTDNIENKVTEKMLKLKQDKPTFPISTPHKLGVGVLSLIFSIALAFIFVEERQRGIALLISIPLAVCIIYFFYLWMKDNESMKIYKLYRDDMTELMKQKDPDYVPKNEKLLFSEIGTIKLIVGFLALCVLAISIAMQVEKVRMSITFNLLFIALLILFVILEDYEGKSVEREINSLEKKLFVSIDNEIRNQNQTLEGGTTGLN